ncbi:MAG: HAMP domain-containing sensor histidine kinase [Kiritimatiellia bacterium]|jgi:signal transduction histidine kinase|nr:HAMP domain-containing sensor histidine kinase [Kiritimatiellia bacterium]
MTHLHYASLSSTGARKHFDVAVVLLSVVPALMIAYFTLRPGAGFLDAIQTLAVWLAVGISHSLGYAILLKYPRTIIRLRACLEDIVRGEFPGDVSLVQSEDDIASIEKSMNLVLASLKQKVERIEIENTELQGRLLEARKLEAIGVLAGGIAHEINTPLQLISSNLQLLTQAFSFLTANTAMKTSATAATGAVNAAHNGEEDTAARFQFFTREVPMCLDQSEDGVTRIANTVRAMRDFADKGEGKTKSLTDINKVIQNTVAVSISEWKYVANIETYLDASLPPVHCYPGEIKQTLMNLITNSVAAIREAQEDKNGKGLIEITTKRRNGDVLISVQDNGCGIPEKYRTKVFDPFFSTRDVGQAGGHGLSIAHASVVKRHGGSLSCETEVGRGTTLTVSLPLCKKHDIGPNRKN